MLDQYIMCPKKPKTPLCNKAITHHLCARALLHNKSSAQQEYK